MKRFQINLELEAVDIVAALRALGPLVSNVVAIYSGPSTAAASVAEDAPVPAETTVVEAAPSPKPGRKPKDKPAETPAPAPAETPAPAPAETPAPAPAEHVVHLGEVRAFLGDFLADPSTNGKVTELIKKHGGDRLSAVPIKNLGPLLEEAKQVLKK